MLLEWKSFLDQTIHRIVKLHDKSPETVEGYRMLHRAGENTNHLDAKTRELIAIAVAVTTRCDGCIGNHTRKAIELGVRQEEIAEALGVAVAMNAGAALAYSGRALDAYASFSDEK